LLRAGFPYTDILCYLWRAGIDGRQAPQRLEIAGLHASSPSASPTGSRMVFSRLLQDNDIWRYRASNGMEPFIVSSLSEHSPQFSPDGTRIAFESSRSGEAEEIWVTQSDGSKPIQMTNRLGRFQGTPRWSPDGRWIAFDSLGQNGHWDIYVMEATGGAPRKITFEDSDVLMPSWSHDGKWIYFRSDRIGGFDIWRVPFAGGRQEQVTTNGGTLGFESTDGKTLFYIKGRTSGRCLPSRSPEARSAKCCPTYTTEHSHQWPTGSTTSANGAMRGTIRWSFSSSLAARADC
jgi:Tol biopolymer transport system component